MSSSKEQRRVWYFYRYWVTERGYKKIPKKVTDKWSPEMHELLREYLTKKARIAKYGATGTATRYQAEKHNNQTIKHEQIRHLQIRLIPSQGKNWHAHFIKRGHVCSISTKTTDKDKAMKFAVSWYKETVLPSMLSNDKINVLETIKKNFIFLGKSKWNSEEYGFRELPECPCVGPGVYAFMLDDDILKIGKADGVKGLQSRLKNYASKNKSRVTGIHQDRFTLKMNESMNSAKLKGKSISVHYYETKVLHTNELGIKVPMTSARQLEKQLSILARAQGHSMTLSGSD